jgi:hypothetical protein
MMMTKINAVAAIYKSHTEAESAIKELLQSRFDMKQLSIVGRDYFTDEDVVGYYHDGDRMQHWGKLGAFWGGIWALLFGSAFFFIPGVGPLLMAGPLVGGIVRALEDRVGGMSAIGAGLNCLGISKKSVPKCETALKTGRFVLIANGTAEEVTRAWKILHRTHPESLEANLPLTTTAEGCLVGT